MAVAAGRARAGPSTLNVNVNAELSEAAKRAVSVPIDGIPLNEHRGVFDELVRLGYSEVWTGEGAGHDAFTPLTLAAACSTLAVAAGIVPASTRGPAVIAQTIASLCELAPGRVTIGFGSSSSTIVESWNGRPFTRPLAHVRDVVRFVRAALDGQRVDHDFESFSIRGFRITTPLPEARPHLLIAALRPRAIELGVTEADGIIVNWFSARDVEAVRGVVPSTSQLVARVKVIPSDDWNLVRRLAARQINAYFHVEAYRRSQEWLGRGAQLQAMWDTWGGGDRAGAIDRVPDEVIDELFVWGGEQQICDRLDQYAAAGATTVVPVVYATPAQVMDVIAATSPVRRQGLAPNPSDAPRKRAR